MDNLDRRTIVAYVIILIVIFLTPFYYNIFFPTQETPSTPDTATVVQDTTVQVDTSSQIMTDTEDTGTVAPTESDLAEGLPPEISPQDADTFIVETGTFWITLSSLGGGTINSIKLKEYPGAHGEEYAELIPAGRSHVLGITTTGYNGETISFQNDVFTLENQDLFDSTDTLRISQPTSLAFSFQTAEGGILQRKLTFYPDNYHVGLTVTLNQFRDIIANRRYEVSWNSGIAITEDNATDDLNYSNAYSLLGDDLVDIDAGRADPGEPVTESFEGTTRWIAVRNKYFTSIITPVSRNAVGMHLVGTAEPREDYTMEQYNASIMMPYQETAIQQDSFFVYIGPLDYDVLRSYERDFSRMMNFGWAIIRPISKGVLWAFKALHQYIPNYGLVLILFGVVVKIIVFPLTKKSYVSMKSMQTLQPKIQELRDKYKDDSQKMNEEMMKLYKEHGVNPMGGCLPMLLQMPLLYALFIVFRSTIELRGAEFIFWIKDLSQPDTILSLPFSIPLYGSQVSVLPLIMAGTMILQQRMTSAGGSSQQQKMMMWFLPIFFLLIFNNFPSGLNLYYALFNIMTIIQQKWFIDIPTAGTVAKE